MAVKKLVHKKKKSVKKSTKKSTHRQGDPLDFELPTEYSDISNRLEDYIFLFSGERKIGKTTLFQQMDDVFFVMLDHNRGLKLRQKRIQSWEEFLRIIELLESTQDYCRLVVIDTGFSLYELCFKYKCDEHGITDPRDKGWGVVWKDIFREFVEAHERILNAGFGLGIIAHSEAKEKPGGEETKLRAKLSNQAYTYYTGLADVLAHYQYNEVTGKRELIIKGSSSVDAGTNIDDHFRYTDGSPIDKIPMGKSKEEAFKNFKAAFNNKLKPKEARKKKSFKKS